MVFQPLGRMWSRVENSRQDSDSAFFMELMYLGELLTKSLVAAMAAAVQDGNNRHRYRLLHRLVSKVKGTPVGLMVAAPPTIQ